MQHAVSQMNSLSRLGASSTSSTLGRIRAYVHSVETLNNLNVSLYGEAGRLYPQYLFENVYSAIDAYETKLVNGKTVTDAITELTLAIDALEKKTSEIVY